MAPLTGSPPPPPALLLLPSPPTPSTRLALNSSYHAPLSAVLATLATQSRQTRQPILLLVAVAAPILNKPPPLQQSRRGATVRWHAAQSLLAGLYAIVAALCAEQGIQTDLGATATATAGSVDARVVLVDHARGCTYRRKGDGSFQTHNGTTVLDLAGFATLVAGPWDKIFHPSSESGYELLKTYLLLAEGKQVFRQSQIVPVSGGIGISSPAAAATEDGGQDKSYDAVILGGTFDHLHPGHKLLLHGTVLLMRLPEKHTTTTTTTTRSTLIIGVSGDPMLQSKKFADELESWDMRCRNVLAFLASTLNISPPSAGNPTASSAAASYRVEHVAEGPSRGPELHGIYADGAVLVRCTVLNDAFGPTVDEEPIGAICVSGETRGGGRAVNDRRAAKGWHALDAYEVDVLDMRGILADDMDEGAAEQDFAAKISSTAIRRQRAEAKAKAQI